MRLKNWLMALTVTGLLLAQEPARFDYKVREMFFAGFNGDKEALAKGMRITAATLKENPDHAEALVWQGGGIFFQSGEKFRTGDMGAAMEMLQKGTAMMDRAVELEPNSIGVRIPRGSGYLAASLGMPPEMGKPLLEKGLSDFEKSWELQKGGDMSHFSQHSIGELWIGIAEANARLGKTDRAKEFYGMVQAKLAGTPWAKKADAYLTDGKLSNGRCVGCHTGSPKAFHN